MLAGTVAALTGIIQLWLGLTRRTGQLHRTVGRIYVGSILVASMGAFYLAITLQSTYFVYGAGLFTLACAWLIATSMALFAVRRGAIEQHREWMTRSYVLTFAFVTFRFFEPIMINSKIASETDVDGFLAFACWSVPLLLAEPLIQLKKIRRH